MKNRSRKISSSQLQKDEAKAQAKIQESTFIDNIVRLLAPLNDAIAFGNMEIVQQLLNNGATLHWISEDALSTVKEAANDGKLCYDQVQKLVLLRNIVCEIKDQDKNLSRLELASNLVIASHLTLKEIQDEITTNIAKEHIESYLDLIEREKNFKLLVFLSSLVSETNFSAVKDRIVDIMILDIHPRCLSRARAMNYTSDRLRQTLKKCLIPESYLDVKTLLERNSDTILKQLELHSPNTIAKFIADPDSEETKKRNQEYCLNLHERFKNNEIDQQQLMDELPELMTYPEIDILVEIPPSEPVIRNYFTSPNYNNFSKLKEHLKERLLILELKEGLTTAEKDLSSLKRVYGLCNGKDIRKKMDRIKKEFHDTVQDTGVAKHINQYLDILKRDYDGKLLDFLVSFLDEKSFSYVKDTIVDVMILSIHTRCLVSAQAMGYTGDTLTEALKNVFKIKKSYDFKRLFALQDKDIIKILEDLSPSIQAEKKRTEDQKNLKERFNELTKQVVNIGDLITKTLENHKQSYNKLKNLVHSIKGTEFKLGFSSYLDQEEIKKSEVLKNRTTLEVLEKAICTLKKEFDKNEPFSLSELLTITTRYEVISKTTSDNLKSLNKQFVDLSNEIRTNEAKFKAWKQKNLSLTKTKNLPKAKGKAYSAPVSKTHTKETPNQVNQQNDKTCPEIIEIQQLVKEYLELIEQRKIERSEEKERLAHVKSERQNQPVILDGRLEKTLPHELFQWLVETHKITQRQNFLEDDDRFMFVYSLIHVMRWFEKPAGDDASLHYASASKLSTFLVHQAPYLGLVGESQGEHDTLLFTISTRIIRLLPYIAGIEEGTVELNNDLSEPSKCVNEETKQKLKKELVTEAHRYLISSTDLQSKEKLFQRAAHPEAHARLLVLGEMIKNESEAVSVNPSPVNTSRNSTLNFSERKFFTTLRNALAHKNPSKSLEEQAVTPREIIEHVKGLYNNISGSRVR